NQDAIVRVHWHRALESFRRHVELLKSGMPLATKRQIKRKERKNNLRKTSCASEEKQEQERCKPDSARPRQSEHEQSAQTAPDVNVNPAEKSHVIEKTEDADADAVDRDAESCASCSEIQAAEENDDENEEEKKDLCVDMLEKFPRISIDWLFRCIFEDPPKQSAGLDLPIDVALLAKAFLELLPFAETAEQEKFAPLQTAIENRWNLQERLSRKPQLVSALPILRVAMPLECQEPWANSVARCLPQRKALGLLEVYENYE
ncbi:unnamed protein product, partial [Amoebophrya sp. A25]